MDYHKDIEAAEAARLHDHLTRIQGDLTDLVEQVKRAAEKINKADEPYFGSSTGRGYSRVAGQVQHDILWGLANMGLDNLTSTAASADASRLLSQQYVEES